MSAYYFQRKNKGEQKGGETMKLTGVLEKRSRGILLRLVQKRMNELKNPEDIIRLLLIERELTNFKEIVWLKN